MAALPPTTRFSQLLSTVQVIILRTQLAGSSVSFIVTYSVRSGYNFFRFSSPHLHSSIPRGRFSQTRRCPFARRPLRSRAVGTQSCKKLTRSIGNFPMLKLLQFINFTRAEYGVRKPHAVRTKLVHG